MIFKPRSKSNKNCIKDTAKNKKKKKTKDVEDPKILDDREKVEREEDRSRDEGVNKTDVEAARESETSKDRGVSRQEDRKNDDGIEISVETVEKRAGGAEMKDKGAKNGKDEEGEEKIAPEGEGSKVNGEPLENGEVREVTEIVATVETQSMTKEKLEQGVAEVVTENGVETDEEKEDAIKRKTEEPAGVEVIVKEVVADSQATPTNQSPEETQE